MIIFYLLVFVMPLARHRIWGALAGDITGIKYLGMACLPYALIHLAARKNVPALFGTWQARFFLLLYFLATLSYFALGRIPLFFSHWLSFTSFVVLFFVTLVCVDSIERLRWVIYAGVGSIGFASLYVVREWQGHPGERPGWVVGDPNYFSVSALLFLPSAYLLIQEAGPRWRRLYCLGCFVLGIAALVLAASRGGFLGLLAGSVYLILRSPHRLRNLVLMSTVLLIITPFTPLNPIERLSHPTQSDDEAKDTRIAVWSGGLKMIQAHPIFGVGLDNFPFEVEPYVDLERLPRHESAARVAHNSYVEITAELGIPGLLVFLAIFFFSMRTLEQVQRLRGSPETSFLSRVALGLQSGLVGGAVAIFFVSGQYQKLFWLIVFLTMCLPSLVPAEMSTSLGSQPANQSGRFPLLGKEKEVVTK